MISEVVMPQMGADMEEGTIIKWLKSVGDQVERGEIIAEIETDKANVELEAFDSGVFRLALAGEGDTVDVGTIIAIVAGKDEDISKYANGPTAKAPPKDETPKEQENAGEDEGEKEEVPSNLRKGPQAGSAKESPEVEAEEPAQAETPSTATSRDGGRVRASPVARKVAEQRGIDLTSITGTGPDGRIVKRDVEAAAELGAEAKPTAAPEPTGTTTTVAMSKIRQTIARRMSQSKREAPHYYITADVDMTEAESLRKQLNEAVEDYPRVSVNDMIVKACSIALRRHPIFNSWIVDGEVQQHTDINVCIGIALEDGLIAPAILDSIGKNLGEIGEASRSLAERAKSGTLKADEYTAGTFTISNLGMYGVETLVAIIQPPQTAILGVGAVREMPVAIGGGIATADIMKVALSADHRVTDGAQGAQFLNEIRQILEHPAALLV